MPSPLLALETFVFDRRILLGYRIQGRLHARDTSKSKEAAWASRHSKPLWMHRSLQPGIGQICGVRA